MQASLNGSLQCGYPYLPTAATVLQHCKFNYSESLTFAHDVYQKFIVSFVVTFCAASVLGLAILSMASQIKITVWSLLQRAASRYKFSMRSSPCVILGPECSISVQFNILLPRSYAVSIPDLLWIWETCLPPHSVSNCSVCQSILGKFKLTTTYTSFVCFVDIFK